MVYGYVRVSTKGQITNNSFEQQESEILEKYPDAVIYREQFTGMKMKRPVLSELLLVLQPGDILVVTKLDRFARTTVEGIELVHQLFEQKVSIHVLNIGLLEDTTMGQLFLTILLSIAEWERNQIVERTQSGKMIAKQNPGFKEGRPKLHRKAQIKHALELLKTHSYSQVHELTGISVSTLSRAKRRRETEYE